MNGHAGKPRSRTSDGNGPTRELVKTGWEAVTPSVWLLDTG